MADSTQTSGLRWSGPFAFDPVSGDLFRSVGNQTTGTATQSRVYFTPVALRSAVSIDQVAVTVGATAAGSTVRIGAYAAASNQAPGVLLFDAGTVDSASSTGTKTISVTQTVGPGLVYFAAVAQGGAPTLQVVTSNSLFARPFQSGDYDVLSANPGFFYRDSVTGALPDPAAATGESIPGGAVTSVPVVRARVA